MNIEALQAQGEVNTILNNALQLVSFSAQKLNQMLSQEGDMVKSEDSGLSGSLYRSAAAETAVGDKIADALTGLIEIWNEWVKDTVKNESLTEAGVKEANGQLDDIMSSIQDVQVMHRAFMGPPSTLIGGNHFN